MIRTLKEVTDDLYREYQGWKTAEKKKNLYKDEFFQLAVTNMSLDQLRRKTVIEEGSSEDSIRDRVKARYPDYTIESVSKHDLDGFYKVLLKENPEYKAFTYISESNPPMVFQRQIVEGPASLDDEQLINDLPELWIEITEIPDREDLVDLVKSFSALTAEHIDRTLDDYYPMRKRVVKPLETLSESQLSQIGKYIIKGDPIVKLAAPRRAKDQDLDQDCN